MSDNRFADPDFEPTSGSALSSGETPEGPRPALHMPAAPAAPNRFADPDFEPVEDVSAAQAAARSAGRSVLPTLGGVLGGAVAGAAAGSALPGLGTAAGFVVGAGATLGGAMLGAYGADRAQDYALSEMPEDWKESIGQSDRDQQLAQQQHPMASFLGGLAPFALTMQPGKIAARALPNATNMERLMASPGMAHVLNGAVMGGVQLGQDTYQEGHPNWTRAGIATGVGFVFGKQTDFGEAIEGLGRRIGTPSQWRAPRVPPAVAEAAGVPELTDEEALGAYEPHAPFRMGAAQNFEFYRGPDAWRNSLREFQRPGYNAERGTPPTPDEETAQGGLPFGISKRLVEPYAADEDTAHLDLLDALDRGWEEEHTPSLADVDVATAWNLGIIGPGATDDVASGQLAMAPGAKQQATEAARAVAPRQTPDPDVKARGMEPELFQRYDAATQTVAMLRNEIQRIGAPNVTASVEIQNEIAALQARLPKEGEYQGGATNRRLRASLRDAQRRLADVEARRQSFGAGEATETPQLAALRAQLAKATSDLWDLHPEVAAARRLAAESVGAPIIPRELVAAREPEPVVMPVSETAPPEAAQGGTRAGVEPTANVEPAQEPRIFEPLTPPTEAATPTEAPKAKGRKKKVAPPEPATTAEPEPLATQAMSVEAQRAAITAEAQRALEAAGRPAAEAHGFAQVLAERYITRAARFRGALGRAIDLFRNSARVKGPKGLPGAHLGAGAEEVSGRVLSQRLIAPAERITNDKDRPALDERGADLSKTYDRSTFRLSGNLYLDKFTSQDTEWFSHDIVRLVDGDGKAMAEAMVDFRPYSKTLQITDMRSESGANSVGPAAVRDFVDGLKSAYPTTTKVFAKRVTGARTGPAANGRKGLGAKIDLPEIMQEPPAGVGEVGRTLSQIVAYHGSPHDFDRFDANYIGTGEGAQAYGRGFYFAENEDGAKTHRNRVSSEPGSLYKVVIDAEPHRFLDWDKPYSEQTPEVKAGLKKALGKYLEGATPKVETGDISGDLEALLRGEEPAKTSVDEEAVKSQIAHDIESKSGEEIIGALESIYGAEGAAKALADAGVPGVKYSDGSSQQSGSRNFVVFDDKAVSITHKNGEPVGAAEGEAVKREMFQRAGQRKRGQVTFAEGNKPLISLFKRANASTIIHEWGGHVWLEELKADAEHPAASDAIKRDWAIVRDWLGIKEGQDISMEAHEKFAAAFEQYMREGHAPSARLAHVFEQFKNWLVKIYETVEGLGEPIRPEIRGVFARMIAEQPEHVTLSRKRSSPDTMFDIHTGEAVHAEPHEADTAAERIAAERLQNAANPPTEVRDEIQKAVAEVEAERATAAGVESGRSSEPAREAGAGDGGSREVVAGGGEAGAKPDSSGVGASSSAQRVGGNGAAAEGVGVSTGTRSAGSGPESFPLTPVGQPTLARTDTPWIGKDNNLRPENITGREDAIAAITEVAERLTTTDQPLTISQMVNARDAFMLPLDVSRDHLEQVFGSLRNLGGKVDALVQLVGRQAEISAAARGAAEQAPTTENLIAFAKEAEKLLEFSSILAPVKTELGRALGMPFRHFSAYAKAESELAMAKEISGRTLFQLQMFVKLSKNMDSPAKLVRWVRASQERSLGRMMLEFFVNNLISGLPTHVTYMLGFEIMLANKMVPETFASALIGDIRNRLGRQGEKVGYDEIGAQLQEWKRSIPKALQSGIEAAKTGLTTALPGEAAHPQRVLQGDKDITPETIDRLEKWFLDNATEPPKTAAAATRRAKSAERLKDVEPLNPKDFVQLSRTITNADVTMDEARADMVGLFQGLKDGALAWGKMSADAPLISMDFAPGRQIGNVNVKGLNFPVGSFINLPSRGVAVLHSAMRTHSYSIEINRLAFRSARADGLTGDALNARTAYLRQNPTPEMMEAAHSEANKATLMDQGGALAKQVARLFDYAPKIPGLGETPILRFINPFVKISANILNRTLMERTPAGIFSPTIREQLLSKDNVVADTAAARMLVGSLYAMTFGVLAYGGYTTGTGPIDPGRRKVWEATGKRAHSVLIGNVWIDLHRLGPLGMLLGMGADLADIAQTGTEEGVGAASAMFLHSIVQNTLDESFFRGPAELIDAIFHPQEKGEHYVAGLASNFLPMSVGFSYVARAMDPWSRQTRSVLDAMKAKLPFASETLQPKIDIFGRDVPNLTAIATRGLTALYMSKISNDPVAIALDQAGVSIDSPRQFLAGVQLSDEEYAQFARASGTLLHERLQQWVLSPDWRAKTTEQKRMLVSQMVSESRTVAHGMLVRLHPELAAKAADIKMNPSNPQYRYRERY